MSDYIAPDLLRRNPLSSDREDLNASDTWQPVGVVAKRLVKRLGLPPATGVLVLEIAGVQLEVK